LPAIQLVAPDADNTLCLQVVVASTWLEDPDLLLLLDAVDMLAPSLPDSMPPEKQRPQGTATSLDGDSAQYATSSPMADLVLLSCSDHPPTGWQIRHLASHLSLRLQHTRWAERGCRLPDPLLGQSSHQNALNVCHFSTSPVDAVGGSGMLIHALVHWSRSHWTRSITEAEWLEVVRHTWTGVQSSDDVLGLITMLQRSRYMGAGGWKQRV